MSRILSQTGNVIAADFRPRASIEGSLSLEIIYSDDRVMLTRCAMHFGDRCMGLFHFLADLQTGHVVNL
jgi:hypothetical protein